MDGTEIKVENGYIYIKTPATRSMLASLGMLTNKATKNSKRYAEDSDTAIVISFADTEFVFDSALKTKVADMYNKFISDTGRMDISIGMFGKVLAREFGLKSTTTRVNGEIVRAYKGVALK